MDITIINYRLKMKIGIITMEVKDKTKTLSKM